MARPIWTGTLSFGLLNVPVSLMSGERRTDLHFRMLDSRNNAPIRYERVNAETGQEVPWKEIVKAFEYDKNSYVVVEADDIKSAAPESHESVDVESFVEIGSIPLQYFEKPYYLIPGKKAEKGYVLLRDTLRKTGHAGIARVVIRTREYLCAVLPDGDALILLLLRYPQEVVEASEYRFPGSADDYRINAREMAMAEQLISSMSGKWDPSGYKDEFRDRLSQVISRRMKEKNVVAGTPDGDEHHPDNATTNVVDFMSLLEQSLASQKRSPAASAAPATSKTARPAAKGAGKTAPAKKAKPRKTA